MNYIEERIRQEGIVKSGDVLKVDAFLNHQIDMDLMDQIAADFVKRFEECKITKVLSICNTNLSMRECLEIATWAATKSPEFVNFSLPGENASSYAWGGNTGTDKWGWVYIFDLDYTTAMLHDFIYETENANPDEAERLTSPRYPAHLNKDDE